MIIISRFTEALKDIPAIQSSRVHLGQNLVPGGDTQCQLKVLSPEVFSQILVDDVAEVTCINDYSFLAHQRITQLHDLYEKQYLLSKNTSDYLAFTKKGTFLLPCSFKHPMELYLTSI